MVLAFKTPPKLTVNINCDHTWCRVAWEIGINLIEETVLAQIKHIMFLGFLQGLRKLYKHDRTYQIQFWQH